MRSNLIFYNLLEVNKEDSFATVRDVLANKMEIDANNVRLLLSSFRHIPPQEHFVKLAN